MNTNGMEVLSNFISELNLPIDKQGEIWGTLARSNGALFSGASTESLQELAAKLDPLTGGRGLDTIAAALGVKVGGSNNA